MPTQTQNQDVNAISALLQQMLEGWNKGSGETFAAPFTEDADFVAFDGTYTKGRADIAESHQVLFDHFLRGTRLVRESSKRAPPEPGNRPDACRRRHGDGRANRPRGGTQLHPDDGRHQTGRAVAHRGVSELEGAVHGPTRESPSSHRRASATAIGLP